MNAEEKTPSRPARKLGHKQPGEPEAEVKIEDCKLQIANWHGGQGVRDGTWVGGGLRRDWEPLIYAGLR